MEIISSNALLSWVRWHVTQNPTSPTSNLRPLAFKASSFALWCGVTYLPALLPCRGC